MGISLFLVATPTMVVIALLTRADWALIAALVTFAVGLFVLGALLGPNRSSFHAGTKIWQNDGLPGGF